MKIAIKIERQHRGEIWEAEELVKEYNVELILLGYPLKTNGEKSDMAYLVEDFNELLKDKIDVKIKLFDERFSTKRGIELLENKYKDKETVLKYKDMASAYVMLVDYLSFINN